MRRDFAHMTLVSSTTLTHTMHYSAFKSPLPPSRVLSDFAKMQRPACEDQPYSSLTSFLSIVVSICFS